MPIKDENKHKYPQNWKLISRCIRHERASGQCECEGECGLHSHPPRRCSERNGENATYAKGKIVLTVAHLCHDEGCANEKHLKAMCQRCHLRYDSKHHQKNARATRHKKRVAAVTPHVMRSLPSEELESRLAEIADCLNQELRESNGDEFQIQDYLHSDFRPAIRKLVDLNRARQ